MSMWDASMRGWKRLCIGAVAGSASVVVIWLLSWAGAQLFALGFGPTAVATGEATRWIYVFKIVIIVVMFVAGVGQDDW